LFAFLNFGIANLKRIFELTKFKNGNFEIYNYFFEKAAKFTISKK